MKGPSYLQQAASAQARRGVAVLSPPRQVFRPGAAAEFAVREAGPATMPATIRAPAPPGRGTVEPAAEAFRRLDRTTRGGNEEPSVSQPVPQLASANRTATHAFSSAAPPPGSPVRVSRATATAAEAAPGALAMGAASRAGGAAVPVPEFARAARTDRPTHREAAPLGLPGSGPTDTRARPERTLEPPAAESARAQAARRLDSRGSAEARLARLEARSAPPQQLPDDRAPAAAQPTSEPPPPRPLEAPRPVAAGAAPMPLASPAPPPPAPRAARDRAPSGLHIGALEVRVTPPPVSQAPPFGGAPRRAAARASGARAAPISRAFGVFGLGQS